MATRWFVKFSDVESGPIPFHDLAGMVGDGRLTEDDWVRREIGTEWIPRGTCSAFFARQASSPRRVSHRFSLRTKRHERPNPRSAFRATPSRKSPVRYHRGAGRSWSPGLSRLSPWPSSAAGGTCRGRAASNPESSDLPAARGPLWSAFFRGRTRLPCYRGCLCALRNSFPGLKTLSRHLHQRSRRICGPSSSPRSAIPGMTTTFSRLPGRTCRGPSADPD